MTVCLTDVLLKYRYGTATLKWLEMVLSVLFVYRLLSCRNASAWFLIPVIILLASVGNLLASCATSRTSPSMLYTVNPWIALLITGHFLRSALSLLCLCLYSAIISGLHILTLFRLAFFCTIERQSCFARCCCFPLQSCS